jgi:protein-L-isoaspartate O-methyltransferase
MGLALEETGGRLTTIEIDTGRHALAQRNVRDAGLAGRVTLIRGDATGRLRGSRVLSTSCSSMPTRMGRWITSKRSTQRILPWAG